MTDGLVVVDKPAGWTSHDVVARVRRLAGTRRVGHAGTLDPMATGVLVLGVGRATRLLGHLAAGEKEYRARVVLGVRTDTDDADGAVVATAPVRADRSAVLAALAGLTGEIEQVPPAHSAVKVAGRRAYAYARAGRPVELTARRVVVATCELERFAPPELELRVVCSAGTYVRSLARDLGASLGCGAHLGALRRLRVGRYRLAEAQTLERAAEHLDLVPLADAVDRAFPRRDLDAGPAARLAHGGRLPAGPDDRDAGPLGAFGPAGELVALVAERDGELRPLVVFAPAGLAG